MEIPRIAHVTWKDEELTAHWQPSLDAWHTLHPDWTINLWTDEMLHEHMRQHAPTALQKMYFEDCADEIIMKTDICRTVILYTHGGIYADLDIAPKHSLDGLLQIYNSMDVSVAIGQSAVSHTNKSAKCTNAFMMARPRSTFWPTVWAQMIKGPTLWNLRLLRHIRHYRIIGATGPAIINQSLAVYRKDKRMNEKIAIIPNTLIQPSPHWEARPATTDSAIVNIAEGGSWHSLDSKMATEADKMWYYRDYIFGIGFAVFLILFVVFVTLYALKMKK